MDVSLLLNFLALGMEEYELTPLGNCFVFVNFKFGLRFLGMPIQIVENGEHCFCEDLNKATEMIGRLPSNKKGKGTNSMPYANSLRFC